MPTIELPSGIQIRYRDVGPRDGRPIVLAHGFGVSLEMWQPQEWCLEQQYRLITWDARGHGGSSAPDDVEGYTMTAMAADLRGLIEGLDAAEGAVIGGMSFGGMIALQYAVDHARDTHALILSDPSTRGPVAPNAPPRIATGNGGGGPAREGARRAMVTRIDLTPMLPDLDVPTLVIAGAWDDGVIAALPRLADGLPRRRVVILDECTHGTSRQRPDTWSEAVLEFLKDVDDGQPLGQHEMR